MDSTVQRRWCFRSTFSCVFFFFFRSFSFSFSLRSFLLSFVIFLFLFLSFFFDTSVFTIMFPFSFVDVRDACVQQRLYFPNFFLSFRFALLFLFSSFSVRLFIFFFVVFELLFFISVFDLLLRRCSLSLDFCSEFFSTYRGWSVLQVCTDAGRSASVSNRRSHDGRAGTCRD